MLFLYSHVCIKNETTKELLNDYVLKRIATQELLQRFPNSLYMAELDHLAGLARQLYEREYVNHKEPDIRTALVIEGSRRLIYQAELWHVDQVITISISSVIKNY